MKFTIVWIYLTATFFIPLAFANEEPSHPLSKVITLDLYGRRGLVYFDHKLHESLITPDRTYRYQTKTGAACSGCHHTVNEIGVSQLIKCRACHLEEGNPKNPKSLDMVEQTTDEAFHRNCIGCHRALQQGPRLCVGCHKLAAKRMNW